MSSPPLLSTRSKHEEALKQECREKIDLAKVFPPPTAAQRLPPLGEWNPTNHSQSRLPRSEWFIPRQQLGHEIDNSVGQEKDRCYRQVTARTSPSVSRRASLRKLSNGIVEVRDSRTWNIWTYDCVVPNLLSNICRKCITFIGGFAKGCAKLNGRPMR